MLFIVPQFGLSITWPDRKNIYIWENSFYILLNSNSRIKGKYKDPKSCTSDRSIKRKKFDDEVVESSLPTKLIPVERTRRVKRAPNPKQVTLPHTKWGPKDDLKLILAVQQCSDLALVHKCVKFSQKLTYQEVGELVILELLSFHSGCHPIMSHVL